MTIDTKTRGANSSFKNRTPFPQHAARPEREHASGQVARSCYGEELTLFFLA